MLTVLPFRLFTSPTILGALIGLIPPYSLVEMISKSFIIQAFIALIILASSLTFSVNAAAITIAPARQFIFQPRCARRALLTSDLGISRQDYEQPAALSAVSTADNEKRFCEFLFLGLVERG